MIFSTAATSSAVESPPDFNETTSASSDVESFDTAVVAGVIAAAVVTLVIVLALIAVYLYKHKGSYHTQETDEEEEAQKALQMNPEPAEEKQEYFM
ncbi:small cell adhesion glycoprotein isoform X2 [Engystomops pustulosus]|uniref:small cell adhesion glycoprotein isoform X2 n=1 Tax=Engystomops pustulosus TaxID=76066 RepID=UPI003AFAE253